MPSRYYSFLRNEDDVSFRFVFIDTSPFNKDYYTEVNYKTEVSRQDTVRQKVWMDSVLSLNDADWKIVVGHHPFYTGGKRIDDVNTVRASLENIFQKNKVDVYFAGHEHDLQHIKPNDKLTHHFVSGAGSEARPTGMLPFSKFAKSIQGFMSVTVTKDSMRVQVIDVNGELIYQGDVLK